MSNFFVLSGKKGGKKKGQTLNLTEFLGGGGGTAAPGSTAVVTVGGGSSWADELDDADAYDSRPKQQVTGACTD